MLTMKLIVDHSQRYAKMRAHTATHLLHAQLAAIFPSTKQAGSMVDSDLLRFDFQSDRLLTQDELLLIQKNINVIIYLAADVVVEEMSLDDATKLWAKAFFEDKYWSTVRVVQIKHDSDLLSLELCGWTHVSNTKDIGCFSVVSQEAVASWVKRITAITWPKVFEKIQEVQSILDATVAKLWIKTATQLADKLDKTLKEYDDMKASFEKLETTMIKKLLTSSDFSSWNGFDKVFLVSTELNFKNVVFQAKWMFKGQNILIYTQEGNFVVLADTWISAKELAKNLGLVWWWTDTIFQWRDENIAKLLK